MRALRCKGLTPPALKTQAQAHGAQSPGHPPAAQPPQALALFWDAVWPQLEASGWAAVPDAAAASGTRFFPPCGLHTEKQAPLVGVPALLEHLQRHPDAARQAGLLAPPAAAEPAASWEAPSQAAPEGEERGEPAAKVCENCGTTVRAVVWAGQGAGGACAWKFSLRCSSRRREHSAAAGRVL